MTAVFDNHDLQFMYPKNWTLSQNDETKDFVEISLESPEGSIWSVSIFSPDSQPVELLESCAKALSDQYEDFERIDFSGDVDGLDAIGFDSNFFCLDFLVTAQARVIRAVEKILNIYCQAESREFDQKKDVFDAITISLLRSLDSRCN